MDLSKKKSNKHANKAFIYMARIILVLVLRVQVIKCVVLEHK